jgi:hypothetical protein
MDRVSGKIGLKGLVRGVLLADQQRLAMSALSKLRKACPGVSATVVGLGDARPLPDGVTDLRTRKMSVDTELAWCAAYANSQFVIGVHGSNMLLPTAFAAGCIEILPHDRYRNLAQDVTTRWTDVMQVFLYRFVDEFATPTAVARHAVSMFNDYAVFHRNNRINIY